VDYVDTEIGLEAESNYKPLHAVLVGTGYFVELNTRIMYSMYGN
jgi:hypothetical protein